MALVLDLILLVCSATVALGAPRLATRDNVPQFVKDYGKSAGVFGPSVAFTAVSRQSLTIHSAISIYTSRRALYAL